MHEGANIALSFSFLIIQNGRNGEYESRNTRRLHSIYVTILRDVTRPDRAPSAIRRKGPPPPSRPPDPKFDFGTSREISKKDAYPLGQGERKMFQSRAPEVISIKGAFTLGLNRVRQN